MEAKEMIFLRKSVRSYTNEPVTPELLAKIYAMELTPLYPEIAVRWEIVGRDQVKCICPWTTPQVITIYSQKAEGDLENIGFLFQQLELRLQAMGLGVCWLGMGQLNQQAAPNRQDDMQFRIMLAFGHPKGHALREGPQEFRRKTLSQIADHPDERLEPARLAPSSVNSQPWYFTHDGGCLHVYCTTAGLLQSKARQDMNRIDIGIALAHLWISNPDTFRFFRTENAPVKKKYLYIGTITL